MAAKYDPKFCQIALDTGLEGLGFEALAERIGVTIDTLRRWDKEHADFHAAATKAWVNDKRRELFTRIANERAEREAKAQRRREARERKRALR